MQNMGTVSYARKWVTFINIIALSLLVMAAEAADLIVNGTQTTVPGGTYNVVYIANNGNLTVNGPLIANTIYLDGSVIMTVNGTTTANTITVSSGTASLNGNTTVSNTITVTSGLLTVTGTNNVAGTVSIEPGSVMSVLGTWTVGSLRVNTNGVLSPVVYSSTPGSGSFRFIASSVRVEYGGTVNGDYAGNDPRGRANSFANAGGGGGGGAGAHGWWDASTAGPAFGDDYTYICDMGSAGGNMGGGGIAFIANTVTINGNVHANGYNGWYVQFQWAPGGGSGGGIFIDTTTLTLNGTLTCNGGDGDGYAGPGGGGRIKVFYLSGGGTNLASLCSVAPGPNHPNKGPAQAGTVYFDAKPVAPTLISPLSGDTVSGSGTTFRFTVYDGSVLTDGRNDLLFSIIELSTNGFQTVTHSFDQSQSSSGWSSFSNRNGETVTFVSPVVIPQGTYRWRAVTKDRSVSGVYSPERVINIGAPVYITGPTLHIDSTIKLSFQSQHFDYRVQTSSDLQTWTNTDIVIIGDGSVIEFYLPVGIGSRFYRLLVL